MSDESAGDCGTVFYAQGQGILWSRDTPACASVTFLSACLCHNINKKM